MTGRPKGVITTHGGVLDRVRHAQTGKRGIHERVLGIGSRAVYFRTLLTDATSMIFDVKRDGFHALANWMAREHVTCLQAQTTAFRSLLQALPGGRALPEIRLVGVGGEPVYGADILAARPFFAPDCEFVTGFSMSETGSLCRYRIDVEQIDAHKTLPAGYPLPDREILILDDANRSVAPGMPGQIAVRSRFLAAGYWNQPELSQSRYLPSADGTEVRTFLTGDRGRFRADGCLELLRREDLRVKIRGQRVDLEEVEAILRRQPGVQQAAVAAKAGVDGELRLVAYVVAQDGDLTTSALHAALRRQLPSSMIPTAWVMLDQLPVTPSGKIDRPALPNPGQVRPVLETAYVAPRTPIEAKLAQIWADVLQIESVGIYDNFLELGGHSLLASRIAAAAADTFGIQGSASMLLKAPTIADMALLVVQALIQEEQRETRAASSEKNKNAPDLEGVLSGAVDRT